MTDQNKTSQNLNPSLPEIYQSIEVYEGKNFLKKLFSFTGPGLLVAVGYMDPGNWATDLAAGAQFGYSLLFVILISNFFAMVLQHLALKLGIVGQLDLAQACKKYYSKPTSLFLWLICEIAICACDLAEVIGSAIALKLLFDIPLVFGVIITVIDVLIIMMLQKYGFRKLEAFIASLLILIAGCFSYELIVAKPDFHQLMLGFIPNKEILTNSQMLYLSIGILGATVMPHNLYLHSSIIQSRKFSRDHDRLKSAVRLATIDSTISLGFAFFINAAILILSAAAFYNTQYSQVADINDAYHLLSGVLNDPWASKIFGIALLAASQNATLTGTLAGQIVMEGFLNLKLTPWIRNLITRSIAIVPAAVVAIIYGEKGLGELLILSQVILSAQLSFAVFPLIKFTSDKNLMGKFSNTLYLKTISLIIAIIIATLNIYLLWKTWQQI